jgi:hypothetical protein
VPVLSNPGTLPQYTIFMLKNMCQIGKQVEAFKAPDWSSRVLHLPQFWPHMDSVNAAPPPQDVSDVWMATDTDTDTENATRRRLAVLTQHPSRQTYWGRRYAKAQQRRKLSSGSEVPNGRNTASKMTNPTVNTATKILRKQRGWRTKKKY